MAGGGGGGGGNNSVVMAVHGCGGFTLLFHFLYIFFYMHTLSSVSSRD